MVNSGSKNSRRSPIEILEENFGQSFKELSREDRFALVILMGQIARSQKMDYSLTDAYRELPGENVSDKLFNLLGELSESLTESNLIDSCQELIESLRIE